MTAATSQQQPPPSLLAKFTIVDYRRSRGDDTGGSMYTPEVFVVVSERRERGTCAKQQRSCRFPLAPTDFKGTCVARPQACALCRMEHYVGRFSACLLVACDVPAYVV